MQPDYVRVELKQNSNHGFLKKVMPDVLVYPLFYQPGRMNISMDHMGDFEGLEVELPFGKQELSRVKQSWVEDYFRYMETKLKLQNVAFFVSNDLSERFPVQKHTYEFEMRLLLIKDSLDYLMRKHRINRKTAELTVIDDGTWHLDYVVRQLAPGLNHMTVVTDRKADLSGLLDEILKEHGLCVSVNPMEAVSEFSADITVNLLTEKEKATCMIRGTGILLDFGYSDKKAVRLCQINPALTVYHSCKLKSVKDTIGLDELSEILYFKEPLFRQFVKGSLEETHIRELMDVWDRYFVEMVRVF